MITLGIFLIFSCETFMSINNCTLYRLFTEAIDSSQILCHHCSWRKNSYLSILNIETLNFPAKHEQYVNFCYDSMFT